MKKLLFLLAVCLSAAAVNAQITTGESSSKVVRTGNRAEAGNLGIYVGGTTDMFKNLLDDEPEFTTLPLINLKYMSSDEVELRIGIEWWRMKNKDTSESKDYDYMSQTSQSSFTLSPGLAYHFSNKNLLDVYVGGELPFGWGANTSEWEMDGDGNKDDDSTKTSNFKIGLGAFIGLQAYIGNLPLALGIEYGISAMYGTVKDGYITQDGMTIDYDKSYQEDHNQSKWELGNQVRFTLSYYFDL